MHCYKLKHQVMSAKELFFTFVYQQDNAKICH